MNLDTLPVRPYAEGMIRIATTVEPGTGKVKFEGRIEVLSRHHQEREDDAQLVPRLAVHPISESLLDHKPNKDAGKLVEIPIRMFFGKTRNALSAAYQAYDAAGHPVCRGNGNIAKRGTTSVEGVHVVSEVPCAGSDACEFANSGQAQCRRQVCMTVQIHKCSDPLSTFEVRSTAYNSYKTLKGQLELVERRFGSLRHVPLKLQLWQTSNQASNFETFDVFKLALDAATELDAMKVVKLARAEEAEAGLECDVDAAYAAPSEEVGDDEFEVVSDFYAARSTPAFRRRGGVSFLDQDSIDKGQRPGALLADQFINQALERAEKTPGPAQASHDVTHQVEPA